ncbi:hypothetical protein [Bacillus smithii]
MINSCWNRSQSKNQYMIKRLEERNKWVVESFKQNLEQRRMMMEQTVPN